MSRLLFKVVSHVPDSKKDEILLHYDPKLVKLIEEKRVEDIDFDILAPGILERFTYMRCMNILNFTYFSKTQLLGALDVAFKSLRDNGIFQVGKTDKRDGKNEVSFYRKTGGNFVLLTEINHGTEIKEVIDEYNRK